MELASSDTAGCYRIEWLTLRPIALTSYDLSPEYGYATSQKMLIIDDRGSQRNSANPGPIGTQPLLC